MKNKLKYIIEKKISDDKREYTIGDGGPIRVFDTDLKSYMCRTYKDNLRLEMLVAIACEKEPLDLNQIENILEKFLPNWKKSENHTWILKCIEDPLQTNGALCNDDGRIFFNTLTHGGFILLIRFELEQIQMEVNDENPQ
jgi:hypothetical protein